MGDCAPIHVDSNVQHDWLTPTLLADSVAAHPIQLLTVNVDLGNEVAVLADPDAVVTLAATESFIERLAVAVSRSPCVTTH